MDPKRDAEAPAERGILQDRAENHRHFRREASSCTVRILRQRSRNFGLDKRVAAINRQASPYEIVLWQVRPVLCR